MENKNCNLPRKSKVQNLKDYSKKVNWVLFILLSLFCISSWVSANSKINYSIISNVLI